MGDEMTLYEGDIDSTTSGWVTTLQLALERAGFGPEGGVDGKFGWRTKAAVVAFQQAQGFADHGGTVGNQTWAALMGRDPEPAGTNNAAHGGLYHQHPEADHVPEVRPDSLMMEDPSVWVGAAVDYHNDPELASIIADVDSAFASESGYGSTFEAALSSRPHDAQWARLWLDKLKEIADLEAKMTMEDRDTVGKIVSSDNLRAMVTRVAPGSEKQVVDWFEAQLKAWEDAMRRWRFVTAERLFAEYVSAIGAWEAKDMGDMSL